MATLKELKGVGEGGIYPPYAGDLMLNIYHLNVRRNMINMGSAEQGWGGNHPNPRGGISPLADIRPFFNATIKALTHS